MLEECCDVDFLALGDYEYIDKYTVIHPQKISVNLHLIRVSYGRIPSSNIYDYIYPESRTPSQDDNVSMNMEGDVVLKCGWSFESIKGTPEAEMWSVEKGTIIYSGDDLIITKTDNGFHYKLPVKLDKDNREYCEWSSFIKDTVKFGK